MVNLCLKHYNLPKIYHMDPDPRFEHRPGPIQLLNMDPIWIRFHNTGPETLLFLETKLYFILKNVILVPS